MGAKLRRLWGPAPALYLLSPITGEMLVGSTPPLGFVNPFGLIFLCGLYGGGAVLIRELVVRWGKGWPSVFVLGAAYGIVEEGLACRSFFDPRWKDLGHLGEFGRWAGTNWVWAVHLTLYHAVVSIAIPVLLVSLSFPEARRRLWVSDRGLRTLAVWFLFVVSFLFFLLPSAGNKPYVPPAAHVALTVLLVVYLAGVARELPAAWAPKRGRPAPRPRWFLAAGLLATVVQFLIAFGCHDLRISPAAAVGLLLAIPALAGRAVWRRSAQWGDPHRLALAAGVLLPFLVGMPFQEFAGKRGMALAALLYGRMLVRLASKVNGSTGKWVNGETGGQGEDAGCEMG